MRNRRTFERLQRDHDAHVNAALVGMSAKLGLLQGRLGQIDGDPDEAELAAQERAVEAKRKAGTEAHCVAKNTKGANALHPKLKPRTMSMPTGCARRPVRTTTTRRG